MTRSQRAKEQQEETHGPDRQTDDRRKAAGMPVAIQAEGSRGSATKGLPEMKTTTSGTWSCFGDEAKKGKAGKSGREWNCERRMNFTIDWQKPFTGWRSDSRTSETQRHTDAAPSRIPLSCLSLPLLLPRHPSSTPPIRSSVFCPIQFSRSSC